MARWKALGGYPVKQYNSHNRGGAMDAHRGVVCHIAEGTYLGTISWQMNPDQRYASGGTVTTCSTWIVGKNKGEIAQMVDTDEIAWCQRGGSRSWLSIEFAGRNTESLTAWQIEAAALILAKVHEVYGVPLQVAATPAVRGLGHHSMDRESAGEEWGHEDCPGPKIIAQKPQIVARAIQITEGDDMALTAEEYSEIVKGKLTDDNALFYWLRAIGTGLVPSVVDGKFDWNQLVPADFPGLEQVGDRLTALEQRPLVDPAAVAAELRTGLADLVREAAEDAVRNVLRDAATPDQVPVPRED